MRRAELLIKEIRALTGNERVGQNDGVSQYQMVRFLKNAQDATYKGIVNAKTRMFLKETPVFPAIPNAELYPYPADLYLQNIETMQWTLNPAGSGMGFINLYKGITKDRVDSLNGYPFGYILRGDGILVSPPVATGFFRSTYVRIIPEIEKRSGRISAATVNSGVLSALTLDPSQASFDREYLNDVQVLSVVGKYGVQKAKGIEIDSVAPDGTVTFSPVTLADGETVAIGDYVTAGRFSCNVPDLPEICESHILKHAIYEVRYGDYSNWTKAALDDLSMSLATILDSLNNPESDINEIPITNCDYLFM